MVWGRLQEGRCWKVSADSEGRTSQGPKNLAILKLWVLSEVRGYWVRHPGAGEEPAKMVKQSVFYYEFLLIKSKLCVQRISIFPVVPPSHFPPRGGAATTSPGLITTSASDRWQLGRRSALDEASLPRELAFPWDAPHAIPK